MRVADALSVRQTFAAAAQGFVELVRQVPADAWNRPALGVWSVRALVGHASRAFLTIEDYLGKTPTGELVGGPVEYFLPHAAKLADPQVKQQRAAAIAERGRQSGDALGDDPAEAVANLARRVIALVGATPDDATVACPVGKMTLADYLPTRTFELAVHGLDLARVLEVDAPSALAPGVAASCELAGRLAARLPWAPELLLKMTGRTGVPDEVSVI